MSMKEFNFCLMARGWYDHPAFEGEPWSKHTAWAWMIEAAAFKDHTISVLGKPLDLKRGQFSHSMRFMAARFNWDHKKVARFIAHLTKWGFIGTETPHGQLVVTICNYSKYQLGDFDSGTGMTTGAGQGRDKEERNNTYKDIKKDIKKEGETSKNLFDLAEPLPEITAQEDICISLYNDTARRAGLPTCMKLSGVRKAQLRERLKDAGGLDGWKAALAIIEASEFLTGKNARGWKANFDFVVKDSNFTKIMEGTYNGKQNPNHNKPKTAHDAMLAGFAIASDYAERNGNN